MLLICCRFPFFISKEHSPDHSSTTNNLLRLGQRSVSSTSNTLPPAPRAIVADTHLDDDTTLTSETGELGRLSWSKMNSDQKRHFQEIISRHIWPLWKLLGDSKTDEEIFIDKVCNLMNPTGGFPNDMAKLRWKIRNGNACISCFNSIRSNVIAAIKKKTKNWWAQHNKTMPDLDKLQSIATRTIELKQPNDVAGDDVIDQEVMELAVWWWDEVLPSATAPATEFWTPKQRWYQHIHDGKLGDTFLLTPQDEAFAMLCMENYYKQWAMDFTAMTDHPTKKLVKADSKKYTPPNDPVSVARGYEVTNKEIIKFGDNWKTKYTVSNAGSRLSGGWKTEGKEKYILFLKYVQHARKLTTTPAKEALILGEVRSKNKVTGENYDEYRHAKKRARTGSEKIVNGGLCLNSTTNNDVLGAPDGADDEFFQTPLPSLVEI